MLIFELILLLALIGVDLASKSIVTAQLAGGSKVIIPKILTLIYSENYGASFGIFSGKPVLILIISISASVAVLIFLLIYRKSHKFLRLSLIMILAGAIGNIIDRIVLGYVRDFIDYTFLKTWFNFNFAICNVADVFLSVGAVMLIIYVLFIYKEKPKVMSAKPSKKSKKDKKMHKEEEKAVIEEPIEHKLLDLSGKDNFQSYDESGGSKLNFTGTSGIVKKKEATVREEDKD